MTRAAAIKEWDLSVISLLQFPSVLTTMNDKLDRTQQLGDMAGIFWGVRFIVNHDGVVFSKNLAADTAAVAARITRFNPDTGWKREEAP